MSKNGIVQYKTIVVTNSKHRAFMSNISVLCTYYIIDIYIKATLIIFLYKNKTSPIANDVNKTTGCCPLR